MSHSDAKTVSCQIDTRWLRTYKPNIKKIKIGVLT